MRSIDEAAIGNDTAVGYSYMIKAGTGLFDVAKTLMPDAGSGEIGVVCGRGNNGGDGYVAARLLCESGYRVTCISLCKIDEIKDEARLAFNEYTEGKRNFLVPGVNGDFPDLTRYRLIIDAMLGTGARGNPRGIYATAIDAINKSGIPVLAADTPSGLDSDTGIPGKPCIKAVMTVAMGYPKIGQYFYPGRDHVGKLVIQDLGYPDKPLGTIFSATGLFSPTQADLRELLPRRKPAGNKFDHGLALLICGSRGMTGSAILAARAALRTGCGMTHLVAPDSVVPALSRRLLETVIHPVPETAAGTPSAGALQKILELARSMQAVCIGPGISHESDTTGLVRGFVSKCKLPVVLDADGINAFKGRVKELRSHKGELIITPHRGEWQRLFGELPPGPIAVIDKLKEKSFEFRMTILLKGNPTIVACPTGNASILPFGNSALAKAGSGDVLSGIIVSLLAQGASAVNAAILGAAIHGEAGTLAGRNLSEYSVIASDVVKAIPRVIIGLLFEP
jgi:NAD(P)H-hydrate epimerase